jgi:hypothetical protein
MKTVKLSEESYNKLKKKLVNEIGYGNDDLPNLFSEIENNISDALQVVRDHLIMCNRMNQQPNSNVLQIKEHLEAIEKLVDFTTIS